MEDNRYVYAVARIRALETTLITPQTKRELLEAEDEENLFRILRTTVYGAEKEAFEEKMDEEYVKTVSLLKKLSLDPELTKLLTLRYDFHNVKVLTKAKHFPQDVEFLLVEGGNLDIKKLEYAISEGRMRNLPIHFVDGIERAESEFEKSPDAKTIDMVLDREFAKTFYRCSLEYRHKFFIGFSVCFSDLSNIRSFFRVRNLKKNRDTLDKVLFDNGTVEKNLFFSFLDEPVEEFVNRLRYSEYSDLVREGADYWGEKGSLARLERLIDEYLLHFAERTRYVVFGPEPLFAYLMRKDNELKSIRTIVLGKTNSVPIDMIKERIPVLS